MLIEQNIERCKQKFHGGVLTIGNYDGLHLGHQALLRRVQSAPGPRIVITFDPHPVQLLYPDRVLRRLVPREDLRERLPEFGIDLLLILPFDRALAALSPNVFLEQMVQQNCSPRQMIVGYDFAFGNGRSGSLETLQAWGKAQQVRIEVVPPLQLLGETVSSRRIRECVESGDMKTARLLLGRPFYLRGEVVSGVGRGAQIGVPTLNQKVVNETLPRAGVYASRVRVAGHQLDSVTNVGTNPTFESGNLVKVETHIIEGAHSLRGTLVDVDLLEYLRPEQKFADGASLVTQIKLDIERAQSFFRAQK